MVRTIKTISTILIVVSLCLGSANGSTTDSGSSIKSSHLQNLKFRQIGPAVTGGRIHDVEGLPDDPSTLYIATASGGIWKSVNKGTTWKPIFDEQVTSSFGDLAIAPSNNNVIWAGTGGQNNRQSTSWGNGIYVSRDAGDSWTHKGLTETRHIGRVRIAHDNPDVVYVAALGNLWKGTPERGVFKTVDGGDSWEKVLFIDESTGVVDLVIHPKNAKVLYAAAYQRLRRTWGFNGGGPGSGIYKTTDGGKTWTELTNGLPEGDMGRIGLAISQTNPDKVYAIVQHAEESGVYRTDDAGATWEKVNQLNPRPMYYSHIFVDPHNDNRVYVLATEFYMSEDGGTTFRQMPTRPIYDVGIHSDHHTLWIDPTDTEHFYLAGDAGLHETFDRGETYNRLNNMPIGQFYAIGYDMETPYNVYGGMQDNHSWMGPSATRRWIGIVNDDWKQIGFGDGIYQQVDPTSNRYVYSNAQNGGVTRLDAKTGDLLDIRPTPPFGEPRYRFDWASPSLLSKHKPKTIYHGGNRLFISKDRGNSWSRTKDLSRQIDRDELELMGVKGSDIKISRNDGTASFGEITTIGESPSSGKILWVGTDDGNVQVSQDGGRTWNEVSGNIAGVPDGTYVSRVIGSAKGRSVAYATFDAHRDGDWSPYVARTTDFGQTWTMLTNGLPDDGSVNVIVEDQSNPNLLFLGTEHALYLSTNAGEEWVRFMSNLPTTLYDDLMIHSRDRDLIIGTHGRSIYILDDISPLAEWTPLVANSPAHLFSIRPAVMFHTWKSTSYRGQGAYNGENPAPGAFISYHIASQVESVEITITNSKKRVIRTLKVDGSAGIIHRINWDLRHEPPPFRPFQRREVEGLIYSEDILPAIPHSTDPRGPFVSPGKYTVTLTAGSATSTQTVVVKGDPEMPISKKQWRQRESYLVEMLVLQNRAWDWQQRATALRDGYTQVRDSLSALDNIEESTLETAKSNVERATSQTRGISNVRSQLYRLAGALNGGTPRQGSLYPPTKTHLARKAELEKRLEEEIKGILELE